METLINRSHPEGQTPRAVPTKQVPNLTLNIERLVFDGYSRGDSLRIKESMEQTLKVLCSEQGHLLSDQSSRHRERLSPLFVPASSGTPPRVLGESIARMIFRRLRYG